MADGTAWRLVSQCATVEDLVRVFRTLAKGEGFERIPVSGIGPGGGSQVRLVLALSTKAAVLDGDALVTRDAGTVTVSWTKLDARGKGLLAHMHEHRDTPAPPAVPRHLVPLGAVAGTSASARGDASMAKCVFEPMGASGPAAVVSASVEKPKREAQKTLMGMPTLSAARGKPASVPPGVIAPVVAVPAVPASVAAAPASVAAVPASVARTRSAPGHAATPAVIGPQPSSGATTTPVVAMGTPPVGLAESAPVPVGNVELGETGPTKPTRRAGVAAPAVSAAARAIAAAPSGPVDDGPTVPNEELRPADDVITDVSVALPDLPAGDYVDPIVEPPVSAPTPAPVPVYAAAGSSPGWPAQPAHVPVPVAAYPPQPYYPTPYPAQPGIAPMMIERDDDMTEMVQLVRPTASRRWPVIAATSGVIVVGVAVMVVLAARGGDGNAATNAPPATAKSPTPATGAATGTATGAAATVAPPGTDPVAAPTRCTVSFTSSPDAAEVVLDGEVIGTTPFEREGPCTAYEVTFRRDKYASLTAEVPAGAPSLDVRLERPPFKVRVTSRPSRATVVVGGETVGKTPVTITLPGFETTSIELVHGGRTTTQRVYAGKSGQKVDVKLRRR